MRSIKIGIRGITFIIISFFTIASYAQPYEFKTVIPFATMVYSYLDKEIDPEITLADFNPSSDDINLKNSINSLSEKPTILLVWKTIDYSAMENGKLIERIIQKNQKDYNFILIYKAVNDIEDFGIQFAANETEILNKYGINWSNIKTYIDYKSQMENTYGLDGELTAVVLDKKRTIIQIINSIEIDYENFYNEAFAHLKNKNFEKGKWYYDENSYRVEKMDEAQYYVNAHQTDNKTINIKIFNKNSDKYLANFSYKTTSTKSLINIKNFYATGNFEFYDNETKKLIIKGDCDNGLINNIIYKDLSDNIVLEVKDMQYLNKNLTNNTEEVVNNLFRENKDKVLKPINTNPQGTIFQNNGENNVLRKFDDRGHLIFIKFSDLNGNALSERTYDKYKTYYENGKLKQIEYYINNERDYSHSEKYYINGNKQEIKSKEKEAYYYRNGTAFWISDKTNKKKLETLYYEDGKTAAIIKYDSNGHVSCESIFYNKNNTIINKPYTLDERLNTLFNIYFEITSTDDAYKKNDTNTESFITADPNDLKKASRNLFDLSFPLDNLVEKEKNGHKYKEKTEVICN
ncbi:hypothetical protein [Flavobacterium sp.]|uniref:hypothetical protein n=1 Tax=Flavobacteriaceae TaxID=49546 RepID=UPI0040478EAC